MPSRVSAAHLTACVRQQASKADSEQPSIAEVLQPFDPIATTADVCVVGCGPAGLALAAELGSHGLSVALIGMTLHHACWCEKVLSCQMPSDACLLKEGSLSFLDAQHSIVVPIVSVQSMGQSL